MISFLSVINLTTLHHQYVNIYIQHFPHRNSLHPVRKVCVRDGDALETIPGKKQLEPHFHDIFLNFTSYLDILNSYPSQCHFHITKRDLNFRFSAKPYLFQHFQCFHLTHNFRSHVQLLTQEDPLVRCSSLGQASTA